MVYLNLNKGYIERTMQEANQRAIEEFGEDDGKDLLLYPDVSDRVDSIEIDEDDNIVIDISSDIGFISIEARLGVEQLIDIIEIATKRLNKFKTMIEALK